MNGRKAKQFRRDAAMIASIPDERGFFSAMSRLKGVLEVPDTEGEVYSVKNMPKKVMKLPDGRSILLKPFTVFYTEGTKEAHYRELKKVYYGKRVDTKKGEGKQ